MPGLNLGDVFPNFEADTSGADKIEFYDWLGQSWGVLFSHPADFTPVCTTELSAVQNRIPDFEERGVKVIALSCDSVDSHKGWIEDICKYNDGKGVSFPIIADEDRKLAKLLGMVDPDEKDSKGMPLTCRAVFIISPDKKLKLQILYPATTGRNFDEIIRVIDSLQLTATKKVATPVDWKKGKECMVIPSLSDEEAGKLFKSVDKRELPSKKGYLRFTPDPSDD